jgi:hypothetical protein
MMWLAEKNRSVLRLIEIKTELEKLLGGGK